MGQFRGHNPGHTGVTNKYLLKEFYTELHPNIPNKVFAEAESLLKNKSALGIEGLQRIENSEAKNGKPLTSSNFKIKGL